MAKDPAFLFYPGDWLGGTMHLDFECKGAYMELLMMQFQRGHMTTDMIRHVLGHKYEHIWPALKDKFITDGSVFWNERLRVEKEKRIKYSDSRKKNKEGKNQHTKKVGHMTSHMENVNENRISTKYNSGEFFKNPEEAFTEVRDDEELVNALVRIARGSGYLTTTDIHVMTAVKRFFVLEGAKPDFGRRPRDEIKKHLINWMGKNAKTIQNGQ